MRKSGCTLAEILKAGQWRSAAFASYIDEAELNKVVRHVMWTPSVRRVLPSAQDLAFEVALNEDEEWVD